MRNIYTQPQIRLMNQLRKLWEQHVYWMRFFIIRHGGRFRGSGAGYQQAAAKSKGFCSGAPAILRCKEHR